MQLSLGFLLLALAPSVVFGSLDSQIKQHGKKYFGTATDPNTLSNPQVNAIIKEEFGAVTPENSMKWESLENVRGTYTWTDADGLVKFAQDNDKLVRGHTLVWHSQLPDWVEAITDKNELKKVIRERIRTVMRRYKGKIYAWDVVNEVFEDNGTWRNSVFYRLLGEEFVEYAFRMAHAADPKAKLYINDYNLDGPGPKIDAMIALVKKLRQKNVPIHGVGTQAHLILGQVGGVAAQLKRLGDTKLDVAITELDIRITKSVDDAKLESQKQDYKTVTKACLDVKNCVGITVWGVSDANSWVPYTFPEFDSPLLFDYSNEKKPAYYGTKEALSSGRK